MHMEFIDRVQELRRLEGGLKQGENSVIVAPRRLTTVEE